MAPPWVFVSEKYAGLNRVKHCSELILSSSMPKKCAHSKILFEGRDSVRDGRGRLLTNHPKIDRSQLSLTHALS